MRLNHLPQRCYTTNAEGKTVMILQGESGYFPVRNPLFPPADLNEMLGVSPEEVDVMVGGSMFGWNTPLVQDYKPNISKINADKILQDMEAEGL